MENNDRKKTNLTKGSLILRVVVSGYLLYTVYQLYGSIGTAIGRDKIIISVAMIAFTLIAIPLAGFSIRSLYREEYVHHQDTISETEEPEETEEKGTDHEEDTK